jgi:hypothetical protein
MGWVMEVAEAQACGGADGGRCWWMMGVAV